MTAPRWEDAVTPLVQSEVNRLEEHLRWARQRPATTETERAFRDHEIVRIEARIAPLDAALARLAEPAQSSAATTSSPCARCGHAWHEHVDRDSDNACQSNGCPCARWYGGAQSSTPAAPAQPSAAERWRAVPADVRRIVLRWVERGQAQAHRDNVDAYHALLALAREAEGT